MKRKQDRPLTSAERRSLFLLCALLLAVIGLATWLHLSQHEIVPPSEIAVRSGEDLRFPATELSPGKANLFECSSSGRITAALWWHSLPAGVVAGRAARAV